jgi:2-hydroxychromene-2-carboxylate isomerase
VSATLEFYFDFGSPYSYLAQTQLDDIARRTGASIVYMPTSVMDVMKVANNRPTSLESPNKKKYVKADLQRWVQRYQVGWQSNPHFRNIDLKFLLRAAIGAINLGVGAPFVSNVFRGLFVESRNLGDVATLEDFLASARLPAKDIVASIDSQATLDDLDNRTRIAMDKGLFGVPAFVVGSEMFFGNDRLDFVTTALEKAKVAA